MLDPFAGGGAIPLEAMRLGCEATAVDINPVAWFLLKCTLDYPRRLAGQTRPLPAFARLLPVLCLAAMAPLAACGGGGDSAQPASEQSEPEEPAPQQPAPEPSALSPSGRQLDLAADWRAPVDAAGGEARLGATLSVHPGHVGGGGPELVLLAGYRLPF